LLYGADILRVAISFFHFLLFPIPPLEPGFFLGRSPSASDFLFYFRFSLLFPFRDLLINKVPLPNRANDRIAPTDLPLVEAIRL